MFGGEFEVAAKSLGDAGCTIERCIDREVGASVHQQASFRRTEYDGRRGAGVRCRAEEDGWGRPCRCERRIADSLVRSRGEDHAGGDGELGATCTGECYVGVRAVDLERIGGTQI